METTLTQPWKEVGSQPAATDWYLRLLPCLTDFSFLLPLFLVFGMLSGVPQLLSDGDTGWHIRTGEWILDNHRVPRVDLFSFTMPGHSWFAWEWAWDALFGAISRSTGLAGVAFINILLICFASALAFRLVRRYTGNDILAFGFTMLAMCGSMIHWLARPHLVSWVFALIFAHLILSARQGNRKALLWTPPLMLLWTNLHGGFFVGLLLLFAAAVGEAIEVTFSSVRPTWTAYKQAVEYLGCTLGCAAATLVNPYGWRLHEHVIAYLHDSTLLDNISEFQTISFHHPGSVFFECLLILGIAAAFWCFAHRLVGLGVSTLLFAHAALFSARNIPLFMLLSAAPAALLIQDLLARASSLPIFAKLADAVAEIANDLRSMERVGRSYLLSGVAVLLLALCLASGKGVFQAEFNPKNFPSRAISVLHAAHVERVFTVDQWADYLIYTYYPSQKVFFDGRSDFYGAGLLKKYQRIMDAQFDCEGLLNKFGIDGVMVKTDAPLATVLKKSPGWKLLFDDGATIIFRRGIQPGD